MNAVEIEQAVSELAGQPFDPVEFPFAFLESFGNKLTTIKRLRSGATNQSDVGGVLQRNNIHIKVCPEGEAAAALRELQNSAATPRAKAKFLLATDGREIQAEEIASGEILVCDYPDIPDHFGFFLPLAGITTVRQIRENPVDIRATSRLNRLYVQLLKENPEWGASDRREDMNQFMARLIFCFFAEDTDIFQSGDLFTGTIETMSSRDSSNTHEVISQLFRAMNMKLEARQAARLPRWAEPFPYVNGGLFYGSLEAPRFSRIARSYLLHIGKLDWKKINPDIFGSMIQAVADDEERGQLGMHYTSVPNILKVLNPLFLNDLRDKLEEARDNSRKLLNLRNRIARIRVFDPACGSGNFLVIAYKQMREIEAEINARRGEVGEKSSIPLTNFRGIELRAFSAEIARLALIIAEYQCDVLYRGQQEALAGFLPLDSKNWITCGNALRIDWLSICPPTGTGVIHKADDLFETPLDQTRIDFENQGGETYICGNPPYSGKGKKDGGQLNDMNHVFERYTNRFGYVDYVGCWFVRAAEYLRQTRASAAFVATNSICQGRQLPQIWPFVLREGVEVFFAHHSFKWSNNATRNAGVTCVIVGIAQEGDRRKTLNYGSHSRRVSNITAYLVEGKNLYVKSSRKPLSDMLPRMLTGSVPNDGGNLILSQEEGNELINRHATVAALLHPFFGSKDFLHGHTRSCLVIRDDQADAAKAIPEIRSRLAEVSRLRGKSEKRETRENLAGLPHRFQHRGDIPSNLAIIVPSVTSERREWFPVGVLPKGTVISNLAFMIVDAPVWNMALIASTLHLVWIGTVCGKLETRYRYSNTLGWHTFPVPTLTRQNKADLTRCAEDILLAREVHFPATIAELYDPARMPANLKAAHERNDEVLERIYIGRRFRNDTERLGNLFEMYATMTEGGS
ncbi:MAG: lactate dehydrogenase [Gammaproteobacteria bacterium]|nr:lactate dehydrogenase [Gammaproteobacteria bacterium]